MLVIDFISLLRARLGDEQLPYLWSDEELISYTNSVIERVCKEFPVLRDNRYEITTTADVYSYDLPALSFRVREVRYNNRRLIRLEDNGYIDTSTGAPLYYLSNDISYIHLIPTPDGEYKVYLDIWLLAETLSSTDMGNELPLPSQYQSLILNGVLAEAFSKADSEIYSEYGNAFRALFERDLALAKRDFFRKRNVIYTTPVHRGLL